MKKDVPFQKESQPPVSPAMGNENRGDFPPKPSVMPPAGEPPKGGKVKPLGPEKPSMEGGGRKKTSGKKLFISLLVVIIVIGIIAAGYFFVYPKLMGDKDSETGNLENPEAAENQEAAVVEEEEGEFEVPTVPTAGEEEEEEEETTTPAEEEETAPEEEEVQPEEQGEIPADSHVSIFSVPADSTIEKEMASIDLAGLQGALEISPTEVPLFREVVLTDTEGNIIRSEEILAVIAPNTFTEAVRGEINPDPTVFTYTDDGGTWMGLALEAKSSADLDSLKSIVSGIESNISEVKNFFLSDPGTETSWKSGASGGVTSRYLSFSAEGASFNYGWSGDILLISGSYSTFGKAVSQL